jgi:mannose-6-phosphate isomerase-like protein (cupin superfamily)
MGYKVLRLGELDWSTPSGGDRSRGIVRLSDDMSHLRANIWRHPPGIRGRRHVEKVQDEVFVVLGGTASLALGDPPELVEVPSGSVVIVEPGTAIQLGNSGDEDAVVLAVGAPPEPGAAEYLPDA